jgi:hypothetical protein
LTFCLSSETSYWLAVKPEFTVNETISRVSLRKCSPYYFSIAYKGHRKVLTFDDVLLQHPVDRSRTPVAGHDDVEIVKRLRGVGRLSLSAGLGDLIGGRWDSIARDAGLQTNDATDMGTVISVDQRKCRAYGAASRILTEAPMEVVAMFLRVVERID